MFAGFSPEFRVFNQNSYIATGSESNVAGVITLPIQISVDSILVRSGLILRPTVDFRRNITTEYVELINGTTAPNGTVFQVLNLSTWHASDSYSKGLTYSRLETEALIASKLADGRHVYMTGTASARWGWVAQSRDIIYVDSDIADGFIGYGLGGNILLYSEDFLNAYWIRGSNLPTPTQVAGAPGFDKAFRHTTTANTLSGCYQTVNITANTKYTLSTVCRAISSSGSKGTWRVEWLDASSVVLSTSTGNMDTIHTAAANQWGWLQQTFTSPSGAVKANVYLPFGFSAAGFIYEVSAIQIETTPADIASPYQKTTDTAILPDSGFTGFQTSGFVQLPDNPTVGDWVMVIDNGRKSETNAIGFVVTGNAISTINNSYDDIAMAYNGRVALFRCGVAGKWTTPNN